MRTRALLLLVSSMYFWAFMEYEPAGFNIPSGFPEPVYNFDNNPLTSEKIALGRSLFYDPILSKDNTISCASCHSPYNAFAHTDHDFKPWN